jgi:hypothetical protein
LLHTQVSLVTQHTNYVMNNLKQVCSTTSKYECQNCLPKCEMKQGRRSWRVQPYSPLAVADCPSAPGVGKGGGSFKMWVPPRC